MADLAKLVDELSALTVMEAADLSKMLEEKWGVSAAAAVAVAAGGAAAGAAAHLGGVIAAYTTVPVIGIPINATPLNGMDALLSFVQMPAGIPVATMAINGAKNAALFAVQILSVKYPELVTKLAENRLQMQEEVKAKGEKLAKMRAEGK